MNPFVELLDDQMLQSSARPHRDYLSLSSNDAIRVLPKAYPEADFSHPIFLYNMSAQAAKERMRQPEKSLALAILPPIVLYSAGMIGAWVLQGFRRKRPVRNG